MQPLPADIPSALRRLPRCTPQVARAAAEPYARTHAPAHARKCTRAHTHEQTASPDQAGDTRTPPICIARSVSARSAVSSFISRRCQRFRRARKRSLAMAVRQKLLRSVTWLRMDSRGKAAALPETARTLPSGLWQVLQQEQRPLRRRDGKLAALPARDGRGIPGGRWTSVPCRFASPP